LGKAESEEALNILEQRIKEIDEQVGLRLRAYANAHPDVLSHTVGGVTTFSLRIMGAETLDIPRYFWPAGTTAVVADTRRNVLLVKTTGDLPVKVWYAYVAAIDRPCHHADEASPPGTSPWELRIIESTEQRIIALIPIRYSTACNIANDLREMASTSTNLASIRRVHAMEGINAVLLETATENDATQVHQLVRFLDRPAKTVTLEMHFVNADEQAQGDFKLFTPKPDHPNDPSQLGPHYCRLDTFATLVTNNHIAVEDTFRHVLASENQTLIQLPPNAYTLVGGQCPLTSVWVEKVIAHPDGSTTIELDFTTDGQHEGAGHVLRITKQDAIALPLERHHGAAPGKREQRWLVITASSSVSEPAVAAQQ
jgi:hypothetical protein